MNAAAAVALSAFGARDSAPVAAVQVNPSRTIEAAFAHVAQEFAPEPGVLAVIRLC